MEAAIGLPEGNDKVLEIERGHASSHSVEEAMHMSSDKITE